MFKYTELTDSILENIPKNEPFQIEGTTTELGLEKFENGFPNVDFSNPVTVGNIAIPSPAHLLVSDIMKLHEPLYTLLDKIRLVAEIHGGKVSYQKIKKDEDNWRIYVTF
jgi:hypothetical protein